jgi:hypothetical protein
MLEKSVWIGAHVCGAPTLALPRSTRGGKKERTKKEPDRTRYWSFIQRAVFGIQHLRHITIPPSTQITWPVT